MANPSTIKRAKGSGAREVYEALKKEILTMELAPGTLLDEKSLAERFAMSRSPIREAIIHLTGDGLVVNIANRSTLVAPLELATLPKYVEALDLLQRVNTRLAAQLRGAEDIENIRTKMIEFEETIRRNDYLEMSSSNRDFHLAIAQSGKNPYLTEQYATLLNQGLRLVHLHFDLTTKSTEVTLLTDDHSRLLDAIIEQDVELADNLAHEHTRVFRDRFIRFIEQNYAAEMPVEPIT